jgi:hypothetical protein
VKKVCTKCGTRKPIGEFFPRYKCPGKLITGARENPGVLAEYLAVGVETGHTCRQDISIADVAAAVAAGEVPGDVTDWSM